MQKTEDRISQSSTLPKLPFPSTLMKEKSSSVILLVWRVFTSPFSLASPVSSDPPSVREEDEAGFSSSPRWSNESAFLMFSRSFISADHKTKAKSHHTLYDPILSHIYSCRILQFVKTNKKHVNCNACTIEV